MYSCGQAVVRNTSAHELGAVVTKFLHFWIVQNQQVTRNESRKTCALGWEYKQVVSEVRLRLSGKWNESHLKVFG